MDHAGEPRGLFYRHLGRRAERASKFTSGLRIYDLAKPEAPREIAFLPLGGLGPHRIWYVGSRYAYVSVHLPEFSDHVLAIVDMAEPTKPQMVGKFWLPGMWTGGGETPTWPKGRRYALHHALVAGNLAYSAWRDGGLAMVDVGNPPKPTLVSHRNWDPPFGGGTHSPLPLPDRNLLVVADEANFADCKLGLRYIWIFDVREPANPVSIATMPVPDEADYCKKGGNFGPHNLWENRPGAFADSQYIFATLHNAGVRAYDIANPFAPREVGYFVPPNPERMFDPRPNRPQVIQSCDCFVDAQGMMYVTDSNAGLYILQFEGGEPTRSRQLQLRLTGSPAFTISCSATAGCQGAAAPTLTVGAALPHSAAKSRSSGPHGRFRVSGEDTMSTITAGAIPAAGVSAQPPGPQTIEALLARLWTMPKSRRCIAKSSR